MPSSRLYPSCIPKDIKERLPRDPYRLYKQLCKKGPKGFLFSVTTPGRKNEYIVYFVNDSKQIDYCSIIYDSESDNFTRTDHIPRHLRHWLKPMSPPDIQNSASPNSIYFYMNNFEGRQLRADIYPKPCVYTYIDPTVEASQYSVDEKESLTRLMQIHVEFIGTTEMDMYICGVITGYQGSKRTNIQGVQHIHVTI